MKRILVILILLLLGAVVFWKACGRKPVTVKEGPKVVVSGYVPYTLVKELAGDTIAVEMVLPPGAEPHSFEPTPGTLVALKQADGFIYISDALEPWALDLKNNAGVQTRVLRLSDTVAQTEDPHIWMNLQNVPLLAENITKFLQELRPEKSEVYAKNLGKFKKKINSLHQEYLSVLTHCRHKEVVHIGHLAFRGLVHPYGLELVALSGTSHEGEHSVKKLIHLMRDIRKKGLKAIFTEETLSQRLAKTVAVETGVDILPLYSIEHISKQDFERNVTYGELMQRNLESLKRGLQCQVS